MSDLVSETTSFDHFWRTSISFLINRLQITMPMSDLVSETISFDPFWRTSVSFVINRLQITIPITILNLAPELTSPHSMIAFTIPTLVAFLQIQAAAEPASPFQVRPVTTMASVVAVSGYYALFLAQRRFPTYSPQLRKVMLRIGSFAVASLTSLLFPPSLWWLQFVFYFLLVVPDLVPFIKTVYEHCLGGLRWRQLLRRRVASPGLLPIAIHNTADE